MKIFKRHKHALRLDSNAPPFREIREANFLDETEGRGIVPRGEALDMLRRGETIEAPHATYWGESK